MNKQKTAGELNKDGILAEENCAGERAEGDATESSSEGNKRGSLLCVLDISGLSLCTIFPNHTEWIVGVVLCYALVARAQ